MQSVVIAMTTPHFQAESVPLQHQAKVKAASVIGSWVTLVKDRCRLDIRKYSFSQRTINEWNKLSTDCVNAISVNMYV